MQLGSNLREAVLGRSSKKRSGSSSAFGALFGGGGGNSFGSAKEEEETEGTGTPKSAQDGSNDRTSSTSNSEKKRHDSTHSTSSTSSGTNNNTSDRTLRSNSSSSCSKYVEPPEPPSMPAGGLLEAVAKKVQGKMEGELEMIRDNVSTQPDAESGKKAKQCDFFISKSAAIADRLVVYIGNGTNALAGIWSPHLCVRSGHEGGGIHNGSLGSMLPYFQKTIEEKMGLLVFSDLFAAPNAANNCDLSGLSTNEADLRWALALEKFHLVWDAVLAPSKATHIFIIAYGIGGKLLLDALRSNLESMKRQLSGIVFIESPHILNEPKPDNYALQKTIAQWAVQYRQSREPLLTRLKNFEEQGGCICLSAGVHTSSTASLSESSSANPQLELDVLQAIIPSVFASLKARWSGFRVHSVNRGLEKLCYSCEKPFNMRRWRRHCRTCQNGVCEKCSTMENVRHETHGPVRLCSTCRLLPSLVQWSRPREVRTGEKESVFSDSAKPGKMSVQDFELMSVIGRGACGKVLLVQKKNGKDKSRLYAMKVLKKDWVLNKDLVVQTMAERRILQEANHPFIVQLKYAFQNQDKLYMVMDFYSGGSMRQVLRRRGRFSIKRAKFYLAEIYLAISHLHRENILYRDLKLENIVIAADGHVACTDFGLSKEDHGDEERTKSFVGTCEYLAPEVILKNGYSKPVDWWAFGILAFEMIQGDSPFQHHVPSLLFEKILREDPPFTDRFTKESRDLISKLLTKNPEERLQGQQIQQHVFFKDIQWDALLAKDESLFEVPRPPHRQEEVTDENQIAKAIAKTREAREEIMPDSPVAMPSSPSEGQKHFDRFSYGGSSMGLSVTGGANTSHQEEWHPSMAGIIDEEEDEDQVQAALEASDDYIPDFDHIVNSKSQQQEIIFEDDEEEDSEEEDEQEQDNKQSDIQPPPAPISLPEKLPTTPTTPKTPDFEEDSTTPKHQDEIVTGETDTEGEVSL